MRINPVSLIKGIILLTVFVLFLPIQGCPEAKSGKVDGQSLVNSLEDGQFCEVELEILADGTLYAVEIEVEGDDDDDDDNNDNDEGEDDDDEDGEDDDDEDGEDDDDEDGEDDDDEDSEDDDDEDSEDDDDEDGEDDDDDDDDEGEEEFSAQVDSVASDCSSFVVLGSLTVVADQDGDDDDDNDDNDNNDDDELDICDLTPGMWVEAEGFFGDDGLFHASEIEKADEEEIEIESFLFSPTDSTFVMLGLTITYDENTEFEGGDDDDDDDEDDDEDEDDDD